jgi:hypothetical protein
VFHPRDYLGADNRAAPFLAARTPRAALKPKGEPMEFHVKIDPDKVSARALPAWLVPLILAGLEVLKKFLNGQTGDIGKGISDKP